MPKQKYPKSGGKNILKTIYKWSKRDRKIPKQKCPKCGGENILTTCMACFGRDTNAVSCNDCGNVGVAWEWEEKLPTQGELLNIDFKPTNYNVAVYPIPVQRGQLTPGGIHIPETAIEFVDKPRLATVLAVGSKCTEVKVGMNVLIQEGTGVDFTYQDEAGDEIHNLMMVLESHIMCVFEPEDDE